MHLSGDYCTIVFFYSFVTTSSPESDLKYVVRERVRHMPMLIQLVEIQFGRFQLFCHE